MTRVAKARRRAGLGLATEPASDWTWSESDADGVRNAHAPLPWNLQDAAVPPDDQFHVAQAPDPAGQAATRSASQHLAGMVRRVFLPPPLGAGLKSVLFCGANGSADRSRTSVASAEVLAAQAQKRVCLVDIGGSTESSGPSRAEDAHSVLGVTRRLSRNLWISAPDAATASLAPEAAKRHLTELCARFDYVVIDAPAMTGVSEATVLAALVQGVILVVDERGTKRGEARAVADALKEGGATLVGVVLANRTYPIPAGIYRWL